MRREHPLALNCDVFLVAEFVDFQHNVFCGLLGTTDVGDVEEEGESSISVR